MTYASKLSLRDICGARTIVSGLCLAGSVVFAGLPTSTFVTVWLYITVCYGVTHFSRDYSSLLVSC